MEGLDRENLTALLSHESGGLADSSYSMEAATYLADTVLELKRSRSTRRIYRTIEIVKSRGQNYDEGEHTLCIADGQDLQVFHRSDQRTRNSAGPVRSAGGYDDLRRRARRSDWRPKSSKVPSR